MNYTTQDVKLLRQETGAKVLDCKNALMNAQTWGEALQMLSARLHGDVAQIKSTGRDTRDGGVFSYIHHNRRVGVLLELNCSTDFVAHTETFRQLAHELVLQIAWAAPKYVKAEDVPGAFIKGKLDKKQSAQVLLMQPWIKDTSVTIGELVSKVIAETGENIVVRRFVRFELDEDILPAAGG